MNREQKAATIETLAAEIEQAQAIFAVDYRGISVPQAAELRTKLREADAAFRVVKNSLTERAADQVGAAELKDYLSGPTALTFVRGDVATAAKAIADYARLTQLLPFKGGLMDGAVLDAEQIRALSRLPSREVLYGQLVGVVASPISGLVRSLGGLLGGLAVALGQVREKKESGEVPAGEAPAAVEEAPAAEAEEPAEKATPVAEETPPEEIAKAEETALASPGVEEPADAEAQAPAEEAPPAEVGEAEAEAPTQDAAPENQAEPEEQEPAQEDDKNADVSAEGQPEDAETNPPKED
jgi:large subunit ribosomal protein L10